MGLQEKLMNDLKEAMKARDKVRMETIRGLRAQLKNREIEKGSALNEEEEIQVLTSAVKKRKESIEQFRAVNRPERAEEEERELRIIQQYLPEQMGEEEIARLVEDAIRETAAASLKDMGKVMGKIMPRVKGRADGRLVQSMVKKKLEAL